MTARVYTAESPQSYYVRQVTRKLAMGSYQTEPVACFCGSSRSRPVTDKDRYGLPHAMHVCLDCGILYANPRMTDASYAQFYAEEYRQIYDSETETAAVHFEHGVQRGQALREYLQQEYARTPSRVYEIGCNSGGWLKAFQDGGATVLGVDYGPTNIAYAQAQGVPAVVGSFEQLEAQHAPADLLILNHVLEHATDLDRFLSRVRHLLVDDGLLYVALPGLYLSDLSRLFQQAHPWQFTAETLTYVMECHGFEEVRCDQTITSIWQKTTVVREKSNRPTKYLRDILNALSTRGTRYIPHIRTVNKFPLAQRKAAVQSAMARNLPTATELIDRHPGGQAIIIGGGPSVEDQVETIASLQRQGGIILCIERMYGWCLAQGITPEYVVTMDASEDVIEAFGVLHPGTQHLVSSQCPSVVFDRLQQEQVTVVHTSQHGYTADELMGTGSSYTVVNGAGSVVLCSLSLAMLMGLSTIHLFGFDCHITNGDYAAGIAGVGEQTDVIQVKIDGRPFTTTVAYLAFAQQFFELKEIGSQQGHLKRVTIYGDSLATAMSCEPIGAL